MKNEFKPIDGFCLISPQRSPSGHLRGGFHRVTFRLSPVGGRFGFTLLELLVVISLIGILAGLGAVSFTTAQKKGRDAKRQSDIKAIQNAMEQCYSILNYAYPTALPTPTGPFNCDTTTVMNAFPADPKSSSTTPIYYLNPTLSSNAYQICADLEGDGVFDGSNQDYCLSNLQ